MVDLVKIRKKAKKGNAGVPPAGEEASRLLPEPEPPPITSGGADAAGPAGGTPAFPTKLEKFKETAGKRRDAVVAAEQAIEPTAVHELLTFVLAGEHYAIDIEHLVEIVTPRPVTRIPNADPAVVGIISLRGTIVTLLDVRARLRHPASAAITPDTRVVVVDLHGQMLGFMVDRVLRVVKTAHGDVEPHPVVHASEQEESIRGVFRGADALTILLDLDKLLDSRVLAAS